MSRRAAQVGFTLVEILVVVVILALLAAATTVGFGRGAEQKFRASAGQLQDWLDQVSSEAILSGNTLGIRLDAAGATVLVWQQERWQEVLMPAPLRLPAPLQLRSPELVQHDSADAAGIIPDLLVMPAGEVVPAVVLELSDGEFSRRWRWSNWQELEELVP
jgi:general secretion pathway protein H